MRELQAYGFEPFTDARLAGMDLLPTADKTDDEICRQFSDNLHIVFDGSRAGRTPCHSVFQILEYGMPQSLLPQDVVVLAKLLGYGGGRPPIAQVAGELGLSPSQVHASLKRLERSRLIDAQTGRPLLKAIEEFLIHGVK